MKQIILKITKSNCPLKHEKKKKREEEQEVHLTPIC